MAEKIDTSITTNNNQTNSNSNVSSNQTETNNVQTNRFERPSLNDMRTEQKSEKTLKDE